MFAKIKTFMPVLFAAVLTITMCMCLPGCGVSSGHTKDEVVGTWVGQTTITQDGLTYNQQITATFNSDDTCVINYKTTGRIVGTTYADYDLVGTWKFGKIMDPEGNECNMIIHPTNISMDDMSASISDDGTTIRSDNVIFTKVGAVTKSK